MKKLKSGCFILKGKKVVPVTTLEWAKWLQNNDRAIKQEELPNGYWVSTVFLGLDHSLSGGKPLVFETMVFPTKGNYLDRDMDRYSTYKEAEAGHKKMVKKWSKKK